MSEPWMCDACAGKGDNLDCMCGGSGNAVDAVVYLRSRVLELEKDATKLRNAFKTVVDALIEGAGLHDENESEGWEDCPTDECDCPLVKLIDDTLNGTTQYQ